jgi:hypothetical protein
MAETKKLYDYRSWSEMFRTLIITGLETKKAIGGGIYKNK